MAKSFQILAAAIFSTLLSACSSVEPLDMASAPSVGAPKLVQTDQTVVAEKVGAASLGTTPLPWANPATGSAGVIEQIDAGNGDNECRAFVSTEHTLDGVARLSGLACPTSNAHWKLLNE